MNKCMVIDSNKNMTEAKRKFDKTISRCEYLIRLYEKLDMEYEYFDEAIKPSQDILRAAIVLAVSAFDAYATDCFSELFVDYIKKYKIDDSLEQLLIDSGFSVKFSFELLNSERPYRKIHTLIDKHYAKYTTQRLGVIDELFLQYHIKDLTKQAARRSAKNTERLLSSVDKIIQRRHSIAHDGDYNDYNRIKPVKAVDVNRINDLSELVDNMDYIICQKFNRF